MKKWLAPTFNLAVILLVTVALLRPAGPVGVSITRWRLQNAQRDSVRAQWQTLVSGPRLDLGQGEATLVEFVDYECRVCRLQHAIHKHLIDSNRVAGITARHYPLSAYARSEGAAKASICAEGQGRFREMHHQLYTTMEWVSDANWLREARQAGIPDLASFAACLSSEQTAARLRRDVAVAKAIGVRATPVYAHQEDGLIRGMLADSVLIRLAGANK
jgi:protein-disulfide isomerase